MMTFAGIVHLVRVQRDIFLGSDSRSKGILDLVHIDGCGPRTISSLGGLWYYVTIIDDFSQMT